MSESSIPQSVLTRKWDEHLFKTFFFFFLMWTILKVFIEFVTMLLLFYGLGFLAARHVGA